MIKKLDTNVVKVNHKDKVIVIGYPLFMQGSGVKRFQKWGEDFINWLSTNKKFIGYKVVINQSSEPISNAGKPSYENKYIDSYRLVKDRLAKFDVWLITDSASSEFARWIKNELGWNHLTYHYHFDSESPFIEYFKNQIKEREIPFSRDIFTCNGNMTGEHRNLIKTMWTELNLWDKSYWSFAESSNFGSEFLDVRFDLFAVWNFGLPKLNDSFLHIVTETVWDNYYFDTDIRMDFMSKTGRALATPTPFIAYGNVGLLKHLKELGFQTFDKWWDESYDDIEDFRIRLDSIKKLICDLIQLPMEEKIRMRNEMIPIFKHNRELLKLICKKEKEKIHLEIPNFFNNLVYEQMDYILMEEFKLGEWVIFYDQKFDGGGTTFGCNAISKPNVYNKIKDNGNVLEMCSGPGFMGFNLLKTGKAKNLILSDINLEVSHCIHKTCHFNCIGDTKFIDSDCFDSIPKTYKFDTIVSNPPHFKTERPGGYRSDNEKLISLDLDMKFHKKFFEQADKYLNKGGKIVLVENCDGVTEDDIRSMTDGKWGVEYVEYDDYGWEGKSTFYTIILYLLGNN